MTEEHYIRKRMWKVSMQQGNVLDCRRPIQARTHTSGNEKRGKRKLVKKQQHYGNGNMPGRRISQNT